MLAPVIDRSCDFSVLLNCAQPMAVTFPSMFACVVVTPWFHWKQTRWQGLCWFSSLCFPCRDSQVLSFQNCQCATYWSHYWCSTKLWPYHLLITFLRGPRFADRWMILPPNIDEHLHKQCTLCCIGAAWSFTQSTMKVRSRINPKPGISLYRLRFTFSKAPLDSHVCRTIYASEFFAYSPHHVCRHVHDRLP